MTGSLSGKTVVVTGGGSGIGAACARHLAGQGASVMICGRTAEKLEQVAADPAAGPGTIHPVTADVTEEEDVARLVAETVERTGGIDGVVANAGGGGAIAPYHRQEAAEFVRVLHLNVLGTMLLVKHAVPHLAAAAHHRGDASFVAMSSIAGGQTHPYFGAYTVAKAGMEAMMRNAADEYGPAGVRFNAVRPGFTATEIMELIPRDSEVYASYIENTPLEDVGDPRDVAGLVAFLLSEEARWITGETVNVDGGHSLRRGPDFSSFVGPDADLTPAASPPAPAGPGTG